MRFNFLILATFLMYSNFTLAQEEISAIKNRNQLIYIEGLGAVVTGAGIGYERYSFLTKATKLSGRVALGMVESFTKPSPSIGGSAMFGGKANLELGFNFIINPDISEFSSISNENMDTAFQLLLGFRYQDWDDGFMIRLFFVPPIGAFEPDYLFIPYAGIAFGFAF